jgi:protein TonB
MKRRFALPMVIAVTLEAVVLLCFNKPATASATPPAPPRPPPPIVITEDDPAVVVTTSEEPASDRSRAPSAPPAIPEPPVQPSEKPVIETPVQERPSVPPSDRMSISLPGDPNGDNGDRLGVIDIASLDKTPQAQVRRPPKYPYGAIQNHESGEVVVEFVVDYDGRVLNPHVVSSSSFIFEEPTIRAVSQWRFEPGRRQGKAVRFRMMVPVEFHLDQP